MNCFGKADKRIGPRWARIGGAFDIDWLIDIVSFETICSSGREAITILQISNANNLYMIRSESLSLSTL